MDGGRGIRVKGIGNLIEKGNDTNGSTVTPLRENLLNQVKSVCELRHFHWHKCASGSGRLGHMPARLK